VDSWNQFNEVKHLILTMEGFTDKGRNPQRLYYPPAPRKIRRHHRRHPVWQIRAA
jgi:hypothetical protein